MPINKITLLLCAVFSCATFAQPIFAESGQAINKTTLSLEQAIRQMNSAAPALAAAEEQLHSKEATAKALESLSLPEISIEAMGFGMQKSLGVQNTKIEQFVVNGANVGGGSGISLDKLVVSQNGVRSMLSATWALYSGGKISAIQKAAWAQTRQADATRQVAKDSLTLTLIQVYFSQHLAQKIVLLRENLAAGLKEHLNNAIKLEKNGLIPKAQRMQAQVAYDSALRTQESALYDLEKTKTSLQNILGLPHAIEVITPVFIFPEFVAQKEIFINSAESHNPRLRAITSLEDAAREQIKIAKSEFLPSVFLYGQYNLNREGELLTDLDWIVGIGAKWSISSPVDRSYKTKSATHEAMAARYLYEDMKLQIATQLTHAYDGMESAKKQYQLTESSLDFAKENLRIQEISFKEGAGTSTDVSDAKITLNNVLVDQIAAAYQYDIQLAQLLYTSGQIDDFVTYLSKIEKIVKP